jgi:histidyl-tRNA synthetase
MKAKLVRGTRDFFSSTVNKRNFIFETLRNIFIKYGFNPLETPAMESLDTLTGKYGEEGDQLLFKILNNGDFLKKANKEAIQNNDSKTLSSSISKRALRYDLTVPFARFVATNRNTLHFPYRRYQIQPVWRADNPQKGRYREFYQCDVDIIGSDSLLNEAELIQIYDEAFAALGLRVVIRLNNRKILDGLAAYCGRPDLFMPITVAIDKLDKIGWLGVENEIETMGLDKTAFEKIKSVVTAPDLQTLKGYFEGIEIGMEGVAELQTVIDYLQDYTFDNQLDLDFSLARGLSYYTGCIFEVAVDTSYPSQEHLKMGSIGGGGRYADLTGIFGLKDMSGVGVSFGAARIYDVMEELGLFETIDLNENKVMLLCMDEAALKYGFKAIQQIRKAGIASTIYPKAWKFQKLMKYANNCKVPYVIIIGSQEIESGLLGFKNMHTGTQESCDIDSIIQQLSNQ